MKQLMRDFKAFAFSGNILDLAIGVILGAAFSSVVDTFAKNVLLQLVAAVFKVPDFGSLSIGINGTQVEYGSFLNALINFLLVAMTMLLFVRVLMRIGLNFKAQGNRECDYCKSFVPVDAIRCMFCTSDLEPVVRD